MSDLQTIVTLTGSQRPDSGYCRFLERGQSVDRAEVRARAQAVSADDLAYVVFTSGTTVAAKGVQLTHGGTTSMIAEFSARIGCIPGERILAISPFSHLHGLFSGIVMTLATGGTLFPVPVFAVEQVLQLIQDERVSHIFGPPTIYQMLLNTPEKVVHDLSSLRLAQIGAATIAPELIHRVKDELGLERVATGYGLTEANGTVAATGAEDSVDVIANSVGKPLPGLEVRRRGRARGASGYTRRDSGEGTWPLDDRLLRSRCPALADRVGRIPGHRRHRLLHLGGQPRHLRPEEGHVHSRGVNVFPAEVENTVCQHAQIEQAAVIAEPDERLGAVPAAYIVASATAQLTADERILWCRERLANFKAPRLVEFLPALPTSAAGKVDKGQLREWRYRQDPGSVAARRPSRWSTIATPP